MVTSPRCAGGISKSNSTNFTVAKSDLTTCLRGGASWERDRIVLVGFVVGPRGVGVGGVGYCVSEGVDVCGRQC